MGEHQQINTADFASRMLQGLSAYPDILELLRHQQRQLAEIQDQLGRQPTATEPVDPWLDAKAAAKYMGISANTFDKYRYQTTPRIKGSKLDGKTVFKRSDLDSFIRLYEVKSAGFA